MSIFSSVSAQPWLFNSEAEKTTETVVMRKTIILSSFLVSNECTIEICVEKKRRTLDDEECPRLVNWLKKSRLVKKKMKTCRTNNNKGWRRKMRRHGLYTSKTVIALIPKSKILTNQIKSNRGTSFVCKLQSKLQKVKLTSSFFQINDIRSYWKGLFKVWTSNSTRINAKNVVKYKKHSIHYSLISLVYQN